MPLYKKRLYSIVAITIGRNIGVGSMLYVKCGDERFYFNGNNLICVFVDIIEGSVYSCSYGKEGWNVEDIGGRDIEDIDEYYRYINETCKKIIKKYFNVSGDVILIDLVDLIDYGAYSIRLHCKVGTKVGTKYLSGARRVFDYPYELKTSVYESVREFCKEFLVKCFRHLDSDEDVDLVSLMFSGK
jgi:hypothetical protein